MGFYAPASVGATGGPQTIQHYVEIHRDMLLWPPGTDVTVSATLVSNGRVDPESFVWHYYGRNISEDCSVNGPDVPDTDWIEDSVYVYYQLDFKVEVADTLKPQYIMIQLEKKRSPSQGVGNKVCPDKYYDETDPSKLYKKCVPKYVKKCHPMCSDCYGIKATMEYCIDCNLTVSDKIWTTADRSEFICVAKGTVLLAHREPSKPDIFGCEMASVVNIPYPNLPRYLASSFPYTCTTATPTSSLSLTPGVKFTYKKIKFLDSPIGDFVCPFSCALLKKFTKYTPVCANSDFVLILKSTKYRCCRYGTDEASCLSTCYDKPGSYPYQASICKTCAMGEVAVVSVVSATGEPLDSTCHPLSGPTPVPCKVRNQKMNLCYDCPSGFVGINYFSTEFTCTPCNFKFFDLTTQRYICLSSCNKFPYYYYDAVKKECMLCPTGTYYYPVTGICEATCPPGNFILSNTYCSNCLDPLMVNSPDCGVKCPITEYTLMVDSRVICVPVCPNYLYPDPVTRICTTCGTAPGTVLLDGICVTTGCPPGRFVNANLECLKCHPSCLTCSTTYDNCTSCISGYAFSVPNTFSVCYSCSIECLGCKPTYYRDCLQCVPPFTDYLNATDGTTLCKLNLCPAGTILHPSTGACAPCSFKYPGCAYCSESSCTSCQKNWQPWYIANSPLTPKLLYTSCRPCAQGTDSHTNFTVDSLTRRCIDICGDGVRHNERSAPDLLFYQECDDGNLIDGDGCSSNCTVEPNYVCKGGSWNSSDTCAHTKILEAKITNYDNNTAIVTIEFNDPITYNKSATEILKFKFTNMTEGEDYDWSVTT